MSNPPLIRRFLTGLVLPLLLALGGCELLQWNPSQDDGASSAERQQSTDLRKRRSSAPERRSSQPRFAVGDEHRSKLIDRLLASGAHVRDESIGYFMDVHEARLKQALSGSQISMTREGNSITLSVPGSASFSSGSTMLSDGIRNGLGKVAEVLAEFDKTLVSIHGHTDDVGEADFNQGLSRQRALAAASFLENAGVDSGRILVVGFGESQPIADNSSASGRAANRRLEIIIEPVVKPAEPGVSSPPT